MISGCFFDMFFQQSFRSLYLVYTVLWMGTSSEIVWVIQGLSAVTIAYPIVALLQAIGTGLGMGGAIYFSIYKAKGDDSGARLFIAISNWLMLVFSVILTAMIFFWNSHALRLLGAGGELFIRAKEYIVVISLGTFFQIFGAARGISPRHIQGYLKFIEEPPVYLRHIGLHCIPLPFFVFGIKI